MEFTVDPAQILVAITGLIALLTGLRQKRKSQERQARIQSARAELDRRELERKSSLDAGHEKDDFIRTLQDQHERDEVEKERLREQTAREVERVRTAHLLELQHERSARSAERAVCVESVRHMRGDLLASATALRSEIDAAAARDAVNRADAHLRFDHDVDPDD